MVKKNRVMKAFSLMSLAALIFGLVISCSGGGGNSNDSSKNPGAEASAVNGAVKLSSVVGQTTDTASGNIPAGYAPGKGGKMIDTSAIAGIDPRLQDVVNKMMEQLRKPVITNTLSKVRLSKAGTSSLLASGATSTFSSTCVTSGSFTVVDDLQTSGTTTTHQLSITFTACRDGSTLEELDGTLVGTHVLNGTTSESASLTANLTNTLYSNATFATATAIFALNGTFESINNSTSGSNSALGSFTWTIPSTSGDTVMSFNLGSGSTPVTDVWTDTNPGGAGTVTHTGDGSFSLNINAPNAQNLSLTLTLTNLQDKVTTDAGGNESKWVNGGVSISWTPDLSSLGCKAGTFLIATPDLDPIYTANGDSCPTAGSMTINSITIQFGATGSVTVSDSSGSITFTSCLEFDNSGQMCN